ncbi:tetratricopeptide repeat protein [Streptomyces sp. J2-1]|nr:tetratricopeptide repeat protein [Streptomyces corallincola]
MAEPVTGLDALRRAIAENGERPEGPARNAHAERLLAEAERLDIPLAVIEALGHQITVYNYSSEKDRMFVPFARLLRMWDERPEDFDDYETHTLHWVFKWVSAGMLGQPHIPLASVEKWLGEMEHRYRLAGHSERAVRAAEFSVAEHTGDLARAERAFGAWLAADRDRMADCHACELNAQGGWRAERGDDAGALELWGPVLEGAYACAHEPHATLASSLVPLLRLGRAEEARAHHLRGLRLVRPMESMRGAYADHVEFCALTGNEARGLELLAERPAYFADTGHPRSRMDFHAVVALLAERLVALGLAARPVPGPAGREWTAGELAAHARAEALELAARFDARNGTGAVGDRVRARMAREPFTGRLPLGVRAVPAGPAPLLVAPGAPVTGTDLPALLAEARRRSGTLRPDAMAAWAAVARAAEETGAALDARTRAELAEYEAMESGPNGAPLFTTAAGLFAESGDPGEALAARARGAYVRALNGEIPDALTETAVLYDQVLTLYADGRTGVRQTASVAMSRARSLMRRLNDGHVTEEYLAEAGHAVREVLALVEGRAGDDVRLAARSAESRAMLADLTEMGGDPDRARGLLRRACDEFVAAGLPWFVVEYEARLAAMSHALGEEADAETALRSALEHGGPYVEPVGRAQLHLQLAELTGNRGAVEDGVEHALEAAHWADVAGESGTIGAWARHLLGGCLLRLGRYAEAAETLESALPELTVKTHGVGGIVQTLWWLGDCLAELGEHRAAAERRLEAAGRARLWPDQRDHATLAHLAAESLGHAGLPEDADRAYARAGGLWRALGNPHFLARSLRARAWLALQLPAGVSGGRALMAEAASACEDALPAATAEERTALREELATTHRQHGDLLTRAAARTESRKTAKALLTAALDRLEASATVHASLGAPALHDHASAQLAAASVEFTLSRPAEARARARAVLTAYESHDPADPRARAHREEAERLLADTD